MPAPLSLRLCIITNVTSLILIRVHSLQAKTPLLTVATPFLRYVHGLVRPLKPLSRYRHCLAQLLQRLLPCCKTAF
ncbi:hypothetical protein B0T25DRAFT_559869 [Lasiosphaeria hispida]|uniref:Uncharacterized protein n=1 Tax=Lasiosphaeria hispida TaxID=260671 RepID=A0AAJ0M961_9PEZI|nr:hypothetical protein B0T25DRAFT_559869 [Lasiosphaeria hispida]